MCVCVCVSGGGWVCGFGLTNIRDIFAIGICVNILKSIKSYLVTNMSYDENMPHDLWQ